jgi:hypothetical protein
MQRDDLPELLIAITKMYLSADLSSHCIEEEFKGTSQSPSALAVVINPNKSQNCVTDRYTAAEPIQ